jgi:hypothetical protein
VWRFAPCAQAEKMAAQMVVEGRMRASIDQIEGVIRFEAGMCSRYTHTCCS